MRSFVRRRGRTTPAQRASIAAHWNQFGLTCKSLDWSSVFERASHPYMEIGFGMGDALLSLAERHPERDYLGVEVYEPGLGRMLGQLAARQLTNVRLMRDDALEVLESATAAASLAGVLVYFPDPWPKKRHHKRRLIQPGFVSLVAAKLRAGGVFELATDWEPYAIQMLEVIDAAASLENIAGKGRFFRDQTTRPITKFERRGKALGHGVWDLRFARVSDDPD